MEREIWKQPVRISPVKKPPTRRLSSLPLESAKQYGLLDSDWNVTELAKKLSTLSGRQLYETFARHIMLNCGGLRVVEAAQQMTLDESVTGVQVTGDSLAAYLSDQGFRVTIHNTAINTMRLWLEKVGVFGSGANKWKVNSTVKEKLVGLSDSEISALVNFTDEQRAFLLALCRIEPKDPYSAATVRDAAEAILGHRAQRSSLPKLMEPLKASGLIDFKSGGTQSGKSAMVWITDKFRSDVLTEFLKRATDQLDAVLTDYYRKDIDQVYIGLESEDTYIKGLSLEAYAIQIMRRLGLRFVKWRLRAKDQTGGAEVDAIMTGVIALTPTRWQIQCKNTPSGTVRLNDVAKEVGLLPLTKATHILILANCHYSADAINYAREVMRHSSITIYLLDREDFLDIKKSRGGSLTKILDAKAREVASLKRDGIEWIR